MKKIILTVALVSVFAITGLALAEDTPGEGSLGEIWTAINDIRSQITALQSDLKTKTVQAPIVTDDFRKAAMEKVAKNKNVSQSEHYVMKGMMIQ